jgi:hypothetical protein
VTGRQTFATAPVVQATPADVAAVTAANGNNHHQSDLCRTLSEYDYDATLIPNF